MIMELLNKFYHNLLDKKKTHHETNSYITIVSIIGSFFSSLTFLLFYHTFKIENFEIVNCICAFGFICLALILNIWQHKRVATIFSVFSMLLGHYFLFTVFERTFQLDTVLILVFSPVSLLLLCFKQNFINALFLIGVCFLSPFIFLIIEEYHIGLYLFVALFIILMSFLHTQEYQIMSLQNRYINLYKPFQISSVLIFICMLFYLSFDHYNTPEYLPYCLSILFLIVVLFTIYEIFKKINVENPSGTNIFYVIIALGLIPTIIYPPICGCILMLIMSYKYQFKMLFYVTCAALIYFLVYFYFNMKFTLLTKSLLMMSSGIILLIIYSTTRKKLNS